MEPAATCKKGLCSALDLCFALSDTRAERLWQALTWPQDQVDRTAGGAENSPTVTTGWYRP